MKIVSYSSNFDQQLFTKVMERVSARWPEILSPERVKELTDFCLSLQHNEEKPMTFPVQYAGVTTSFGICAFMDDVQFPSVAFFSFPEIIQTIRQELLSVCEELGY